MPDPRPPATSLPSEPPATSLPSKPPENPLGCSLPFFMFTAQMLQDLLESKVIDLRTALFLYLSLNCDLKSGVSHRLNYKTVAEHFGCHEDSVYRAAMQLEQAELIERRETGELIASIPAIRAAQVIAEQKRIEKGERGFYTDLDRAIMKEMRDRKREDPNNSEAPRHGHIYEIYRRMVNDRVNSDRKRYAPTEHGTNHVIPKLLKYAPKPLYQILLNP